VAKILEEEHELTVKRTLDDGWNVLVAPAKALREAHEHHEALVFFLFFGASSASIAAFAEENGPEARPLRKSS